MKIEDKGGALPIPMVGEGFGNAAKRRRDEAYKRIEDGTFVEESSDGRPIFFHGEHFDVYVYFHRRITELEHQIEKLMQAKETE